MRSPSAYATMSSASIVTRAAPHELDRGVVDVLPREHLGEHPEQADARERMHDEHVEEAVGEVGMRHDAHAAAERGVVRHRDEHGPLLAAHAVDGDRVRARPEGGQLAQQGQRVPARTAGPGHPVRALVHDGVESRGDHAREPRAQLAVADHAGVDRARFACRVRRRARRSPAAGSSYGRPSPRARSLPVPAATMPSGTPVCATRFTPSETMPSPPTTTRPSMPPCPNADSRLASQQLEVRLAEHRHVVPLGDEPLGDRGADRAVPAERGGRIDGDEEAPGGSVHGAILAGAGLARRPTGGVGSTHATHEARTRRARRRGLGRQALRRPRQVHDAHHRVGRHGRRRHHPRARRPLDARAARAHRDREPRRADLRPGGRRGRGIRVPRRDGGGGRRGRGRTVPAAVLRRSPRRRSTRRSRSSTTSACS